MGGKFLLLTATLPKFVKDEINQTVGSNNYEELNLYEIEKDRFQQTKKHKVKVELIDNSTGEGTPNFSVPDGNLQAVLDAAVQGNRVLVIANTVKQARDIFNKLSEKIGSKTAYTELKDKLCLLHSRFTLADRVERETMIIGEFKNPKLESEKVGKILVATQVVEASLDIDADVLFTEIAPLDALVQRMGRVWRRYGPMKKPEEIPEPGNPNVYVWVFKQGLHSGQHYVYNNDLVLLTLKLLKDQSASVSAPSEFQLSCSEYDKFALVEKLYDLPNDHEYLRKFRETKDILDAGYMSDRSKDAQKIFREIYTVSVIPSQKKDCFVKEVQKFFEDNRNEKRLYTRFKKELLAQFIVPIPLNLKRLQGKELQPVEWWVRDSVRDSSDKRRLLRWCQDIYFADLKYNPETGIDLETTWHSIDSAIL